MGVSNEFAFLEENVIMNKDSKDCTSCNKTKPLSRFSNNSHHKDKHSYFCKDCAKERTDDFKRKFPDRVAQYKADSNRKRGLDPIPTMLILAKRRAKKKGLLFNLEHKDINMPILCPVLGVTLKTGLGKLAPESPSLDRINSSLGYVSGNVRIISHRANALKSNATILELTQIIADAYKLAAT